MALFNPSSFFYLFKIGLFILERIWADCQAIKVCFVSKQISMRSFLVQSYCNGCVSGEVNLPTVSLLSRACLFKILYLSAKRNFTCFIFLRRSFPFNDVHHSKKNNNNKVKWVFLCSSSYAKLTQLILLLSYIVFLNKILLKGTLKKLFL